MVIGRDIGIVLFSRAYQIAHLPEDIPPRITAFEDFEFPLGCQKADNRVMVMPQTVLNWAASSVLESVEGKLGGAWVFRGTRVPVMAVLSNLSEMSVREIEEDFPTVQPEQITGLLDFIARGAERPAPRP